jgi:hypothetical protein
MTNQINKQMETNTTTQTHWKKLVNTTYLGSWDLPNGKDISLTIEAITKEPITGADGKKEDAVLCQFKGAKKKMILNKTNLKSIAKIAKSPMIENWVGVQIILTIETVKAFGEIVEALRIKSDNSQLKNLVK